MKPKSLIIVGGGTAGWISAFYAKFFLEIERVLVIESKDVPIIGAGEGSTGLFTRIVSPIGEEIFLTETQGSVKLGIKHVGWRKDGQTYLGPIDAPERFSVNAKTAYPWMVKNQLPISSTHMNAKLMELETVSPVLESDGKLFSPFGVAYHFDGHLVSKTIKEFLKSVDIEYLYDTIKDVEVDETGITKIIGENSYYVADYYIDATGLNGSVIKNALNINWHSYKNNLSVNAALPFVLDTNLSELESYTTARAMDYGWLWKIPKQNNIGCGYVFNNDMISFDDAQAEVEKLLGQKITPIKQIKFDPGRSEKFVVKNALTVGLSAAFLEPLEATSIHSTIMQLEMWADLLHNNLTEDEYNKKVATMYDTYRDFIILHYKGGLDHTEFWRYQNSDTVNTDGVNEILELCKQGKILDYKNDFLGLPLLMPVLYGLGLVEHIDAPAEEPNFMFEKMWESLKQILLTNEELYNSL